MRAVGRRPVLIRRATPAPALSWTSMGNGTAYGGMKIHNLRLTPIAPSLYNDNVFNRTQSIVLQTI